MIRFVLRAVGFILLAAACAALIVDGTRSIAAQDVMLFSVSDTIGWLLPAKIAAIEAGIGHLGAPPLQAMAHALLTMPTSIVLGLAGSLLLYAGRMPRRSVGYSSRT